MKNLNYKPDRTGTIVVAIAAAMLGAAIGIVTFAPRAEAAPTDTAAMQWLDSVTDAYYTEVTAEAERHYLDEEQARCYRLANAFAKVESNNTETAVSPNGRYVGCLQISTAMVDRANEIVGEDIYTYADRLTYEGSYAIFFCIMDECNPDYDIRKACKIWNPKAGDWYYKRVRKAWEEGCQQ